MTTSQDLAGTLHLVDPGISTISDNGGILHDANDNHTNAGFPWAGTMIVNS
jgi:hypothetical protein